MKMEQWVRAIAGTFILVSIFCQSAFTKWCLMEKILDKVGVAGEIDVRDFFRRTVVVNRHAYTSPGAETGPPGARPAPYRDDYVVTEHQGDHAFHADMTDWYLLTNDDMQEERFGIIMVLQRLVSFQERNVMEIKSLKLAYFSPSGTTKKIVKAIAQGLKHSSTEHMDITKRKTENDSCKHRK